MISESAILDALCSYAGIDASHCGEASLRKEISRMIETCPQPQSLLDTSSREWQALLDCALVPETWFFRNIEAFDALARWVTQTWLPNHPAEILKVLSLPCATGEEPYAIAMCLLEAGLTPNLFNVRAGDISKRSLTRARAASYRNHSFRTGFDEAKFGKYFESSGDGVLRVVEKVRKLVDFDWMNLADPTARLPQSDVIFCRNALIYFGRETQRDVVANLHTALRDDGILFLGPVEPPVALQCGFAPAGFPMAFACIKHARAREVVSPRKLTSAPSRSSARLRHPTKKASPSHRAIDHASPSALVPTAPIPSRTGSFDAARALADAGDEKAAAAMLDELAAVVDPSAEFFCLRGIVNEALGFSSLAESHYRKALYLDPDHYETLAHLSLLLELDGRQQAAARLRRRAAKISTP